MNQKRLVMTKYFSDVLTQPMAVSDRQVELNSESVNVELTDWGYVIGPGQTANRRARTGEDIATAGCLVFGAIAAAQWLLPQSQTGLEVISFKLAASFVFISVAIKLFLIARVGLLRETQIDTEAREIRTVRRTKSRVSSTLDSVRFKDVGKIYVARVPGGFMQYQLYAKPIGSSRAILLATGPERLMKDMRTNIVAAVRSRGETRRPDQIIS